MRAIEKRVQITEGSGKARNENMFFSKFKDRVTARGYPRLKSAALATRCVKDACVKSTRMKKFKLFASRVYKNNKAQFKYNASQAVSEIVGLPGASLGAWLVELISKNKYIGVTVGGTLGNCVVGTIGFIFAWEALNYKKYAEEGFGKFLRDVGKILARNLVVLVPAYLAYTPLAALFVAVGFASHTAAFTAMAVDSAAYYLFVNLVNWRALSKMNKKEEQQKEFSCGENK